MLVRSDGERTYFAADCAYYLDKRERGFDRCVYMLGADHHGYVGRLRAVAACAGDDPDANIEVLIGQLVNLLKDGEPVRMSKRAGTIITLDDLVERSASTRRATRWPATGTTRPSTLDLDLSTRQTSDNPVFYVQYAHARISSLLRNAAELGHRRAATHFDPSLLVDAAGGRPARRARGVPARRRGRGRAA